MVILYQSKPCSEIKRIKDWNAIKKYVLHPDLHRVHAVGSILDHWSFPSPALLHSLGYIVLRLLLRHRPDANDQGVLLGCVLKSTQTKKEKLLNTIRQCIITVTIIKCPCSMLIQVVWQDSMCPRTHIVPQHMLRYGSCGFPTLPNTKHFLS